MNKKEMSLENVLDELMLEEATPSYAALLRWSQRYPEYEDELEDFFETWAMQASHPGEAEIDEALLVERGMDRALEILRKQGRLIEPPEVETLEPLDQLVLAAVSLLPGDADIVSVARRVSEMSPKAVLPPATVLSLSRLEDRGLVLSWTDEPEDDVEESSRTKDKTREFFTVTPAGERALAHARETSKALGDLLGDFA
jgi:hypothetical protein